MSVIGGEAAVRAASFVAVLFIARTYGGATLGAYAVSLAVVTVVVMFADSGLQTAAITQMSSAGANREQIFGRLALSKTILLAAAAIILAVVAAWTRQTPLFLTVGMWVAVRAILQSYSQLQMAVLKSVSKARWIGIIQSLNASLLCVGIWLSFKQVWSVVALLEWMAACQLLELLSGAAVLYRSGALPGWPIRFSFWATMRMAAPFGIVYGLANLIVRSDTIVLSTFAPLAELGVFSAANTILLIVYVSAWLFGSVLLPEMVRLSSKPESLKAYANQWARWVVSVTVPCALLVSLVAPKGIVVVYGPAFAGSRTLGSVMTLSCPLILLNSIYTTLAIASNSRSVFLGIYGAGALATLGLDFLLGRAFGSVGIASAIVIREAGMLAGFWLLTSRLRPSANEVELRASSGAILSNSPKGTVKPRDKQMPKTVTIDARWLVGGIGTYTRNLLREFTHHDNGFTVQAIVREEDSASVRKFCSYVTVIDQPIYTFREQILIARASRHCDLLHVPHFNAPLLRRGPMIVSIMDVIHLSSSEYRHNLSTFFYARPMLNAVARKADHIITVSCHSKNEIMQALGIPESKITVIPCGVSEEFAAHSPSVESQDIAKILGIQTPFLLYVGNLKPHKNVATLLRAFAQLRKENKLCHSLVIVGDDARWKRSVVDECLRLGIRDCTFFVPHVSLSLLPRVYAAADLLVMPSTVEGFGLPVLEAMACGTPVVASRTASLPEVAGDAALYFDPASLEELAVQIERILHSTELQASLRNKGMQRAKQFTWRQSARRHIELYNRLLGLD